MSLVVVLPTDPVMPITPPCIAPPRELAQLHERGGRVRHDDGRGADGFSCGQVGRGTPLRARRR